MECAGREVGKEEDSSVGDEISENLEILYWIKILQYANAKVPVLPSYDIIL